MVQAGPAAWSFPGGAATLNATPHAAAAAARVACVAACAAARSYWEAGPVCGCSASQQRQPNGVPTSHCACLPCLERSLQAAAAPSGSSLASASCSSQARCGGDAGGPSGLAQRASPDIQPLPALSPLSAAQAIAISRRQNPAHRVTAAFARGAAADPAAADAARAPYANFSLARVRHAFRGTVESAVAVLPPPAAAAAIAATAHSNATPCARGCGCSWNRSPRFVTQRGGPRASSAARPRHAIPEQDGAPR